MTTQYDFFKSNVMIYPQTTMVTTYSTAILRVHEKNLKLVKSMSKSRFSTYIFDEQSSSRTKLMKNDKNINHNVIKSTKRPML